MNTRAKRIFWGGVLVLLFASGIPIGASSDPASASLSQKPASLTEQMKAAYDLYKEMSEAELWNTDLFIAKHRLVIQACPDTPLAPESCWRLSNIFLTGLAKPDRQKAIKVLEYALLRYPNNPWRGRMVARFVNTLQEAGEHQKLLRFCESMLGQSGLGEEETMNLSLRAGQAAEALGNHDVALQKYRMVLGKDTNAVSMMAQVAKRRLESLEAAPPAQAPGK